MSVTPDVVRAAAHGHFDFTHLRPGQAQALHALEAGHDTLVVMPTGSGKSAIYQIAAPLLGGLCVVVSPLIALQRDQLNALQELGLGAALLNSTLSADERQAIFQQIASGSLTFLLLAPEQFANEATLAALTAAQPTLFVVDEAHCISEWGHDFRPDYLRLGSVISALSQPRVLALTATAAPPVRAEIIERLDMRDPRVIVRDFDRPNLTLRVETFHDASAKQRAVTERIGTLAKPGIVYVATRRQAEDIAADLVAEGERAAAYHAGMHTEERARVQAAFMRDEISVIVATTAFGMGIDKPDVRFVVHAHISDAIDAYYQEIGRAGRDGEPAEALLLYRPEDMGVRRFLAASTTIEPDEVRQVIAALRATKESVDAHALHKATNLTQGKITAIIEHLEDAAIVSVTSAGTVELLRRPVSLEEIAGDVEAAQERRRQIEHSRIEMMQSYAETRGCRRATILTYFGEDFTPPCGNCDNCLAGLVSPATTESDAVPFPLHSRVRHALLGVGAVLRYEGDIITILFDDAGYQTLDRNLVVEKGLLAFA